MALQAELNAVTKSQIEATYRFFKACDSASIDYTNRIIQECVQNVANLVHVGCGGSKEQLDTVIEQVATSCVKVSSSCLVVLIRRGYCKREREREIERFDGSLIYGLG